MTGRAEQNRMHTLELVVDAGQLGLPNKRCDSNVRALERQGLIYKTNRIGGTVDWIATEKGKEVLAEFNRKSPFNYNP